MGEGQLRIDAESPTLNAPRTKLNVKCVPDTSNPLHFCQTEQQTIR